VRLGGRLELARGVYDKSFELGSWVGHATREYDPREPEDAFGEVELDIDLTAAGGVWVRNDLAEIETGGDLHLGGTILRPEITGRLWMLEGGEIVFRDVRYRVQSGSLDFLELDRINPYLRLRAETSVEEYRVFLRVDGTLDRFEYELTSDPSLPTQDIIALLATGRTLEQISPEAGAGSGPFSGDLAANYFAGALTGPFERQLERLLGLERVRINPLLVEGEADPTTRVTVGEEVADDVFVTVSLDLGQRERQIYEVEWRATRKFSFGAYEDTVGAIGGDLRYTDRFWWPAPAPAREGAAPPPEAGEPTSAPPRLSSVQIRGVGAEELERLRNLLPLRVGEPFSRAAMFEAVEAIKRHLVRAGRIEASVTATSVLDGSRADIAYDVAPGPVVSVVIEGATPKEQRKLRDGLEALWIESVFPEDLYRDSADRIREFFHARGHFAVDVQIAEERADQGKRVRFIIDRGLPVRVEDVVILGAEQLPQDRIRRQLLTRPASALARRVLVPATLADDLRAIVALYRDEGFLRVRVAEPRIRLSSSADAAVVELEIHEGPRFTVSEIRVPTDLPFAPADLRAWADLAPGTVYSRSRLLQAESNLRNRIDERGYPGVRVRGRAELAEDSVAVLFEIEPGAFQTLGRIAISGNRFTRDKVIERELGLKVGDALSREQLLQSQHRLYQLGIFRNVRITHRPQEEGDATRQLVEVVVDESPPLATSFGAGYDTENGPRFSFSVTNENLAGHDRVLGIQGKASAVERRLQLIGREPRLFTERLPTLFSVSWAEREEIGFTEQRRGAALRVDRRFQERWTGYARYSVERVDLSDIEDPEAVQEERVQDLRLGGVELAVIRATLDHPLLPRQGTRSSASLRVFAEPLLSEASFVQGAVQATGLHTSRGGLTLASAIRMGLAAPFGASEEVPISERFFAGGDTTLRGFPRDEVGPKTEAGTPLGGEALLLFNTELRLPILGSLKGVLFYDAGNVYPEISDLDPTDLRHVLGAGLRYETAIGPLRLEYGRKLDREEGESSGELFLAIGSAF
jgi:outer membrane protein assembly complex protein YaeT